MTTKQKVLRRFWYAVMPIECLRSRFAFWETTTHCSSTATASRRRIDDDHIQVVPWLYRNDTEADCPAQELIDSDDKITREDKDIIKSTDPDTPIDMARRVEAHMGSDRPAAA